MIENNPISTSTEFEKFDGKRTSVVILNETEIANGEFGIIYASDILLGKKTRKVIIKRFINEGVFNQNAVENAQRAMDNYRKAKQAGLKVLPTYRLEDNKTSILMTNCINENTIALSNNTTLEDYGLIKVNSDFPEHYTNLVERMVSHAILAKNKGIELPPDSYFFLFDTQFDQVDFVIGDLDYVRSSNESRNNIDFARIALIDFFRVNFTNPDSHINHVNQVIDQNLTQATA